MAGDIRVGTGTTGCVKDADATVIAGTCSSDLALKTNIHPFSPVLDRLVQLQPVSFHWKSAEYPERHLGKAESYGLVAQEVEKALPELVTEDAQGLKAVRYSKLPLLLLQALREQQQEIEALREELKRLRSQVEAGRH